MVKRIPMIDYIKAICIFMVIITHCEIHERMGKVLLMPFYVDLAVPCFLMLSGFTLSGRMKKRFDLQNDNKIGGYDILHDCMPIIIPYTVAYLVIITMKWLIGNRYTIQNLLYLYVTGSVGTGGYFVIIYLQIILVFPVIYRLVVDLKGKGIIICIGCNILFEIFVQMVAQRGIDMLPFYRLCFVRYLSAVVAGICLHFERPKNHKFFRKSMLALGMVYIIGYAYLDWKIPAVTYWAHSSFYTTLFIFPIVSWIINNKSNRESKLGKYLSLIGQNSFYIFCVQMAFFTSRYALHLGNAPTWLMCVIALLLCTSIGVLYGKICKRIMSRIL